MSIWFKIGTGVRALSRKRELDAEMDEEMSEHIELRTQQNIQAGMSAEEARLAALRQFGWAESIKETCRDQRGVTWVENLIQDVKYGFRLLRNNPGFTAVAVLTLALGIGANTAIFSVVNAVLLKPLSYPDSGRLVWLSERSPSFTVLSISYPNYLDWQAQQHVFEHVGVYNFGGYNLTGEGDPEQLSGVHASAEVFAALRTRAALGRVFDNNDDRHGAPPVALISYGLWPRRFGGNPSILNRPITLDGHSYTVVGVLPRDFAFPQRADVWTPVGQLAGDPDWKDRGNHPGLLGVARLKPGVRLEQARVEMDAIAARLEKAYPDSNKDCRVRIDPLLDHYVSNVRPALWALLAAVGLVLMIACANVANLLLARSAARQKEMAVRAALGASRSRIARQLLAESFVLATAGGALGLVLAWWGLHLFPALSRNAIPRIETISLDRMVLTFTLLVTGLTAIVFGLTPAWQAINSRPNLQETIKDTGRTLAGGGARLRHGLVIAEVALSLLLLIGAGLFLRSFYRLENADPGFAYERVSSFHVDLPERKYASEEQQIGFSQRLLEQVRALPGVQGASIASEIPLEGNNWQTGFLVEGQPAPPPGQGPMMELAVVGPDYFRTMGVPLLKGRAYTDQDNRGHLRGTDVSTMNQGERWRAGINAIIIDEKFVQRYWPNENPIGKQVRLFGAVPVTVIGVVKHVRQTQVDEKGGFVQAYVPFLQGPFRDMTVVVKTTTEPATLFTAARRAVLSLDPEQPIHDLRTVAETRDNSIAPHRLNLTLVVVFAVVALVLAIVGLYGVLAYAVTQRQREIGLRMALGAQRSDVLRLILGQGFTLSSIGVVLGLAGATALTRLIANLLYDVKPFDPVTFASTSLLLVGVALVACYLPARRAANVDPMASLRYE